METSDAFLGVVNLVRAPFRSQIPPILDVRQGIDRHTNGRTVVVYMKSDALAGERVFGPS